MFYTVYKITNLINQMFYIGMHKTINPYDDYMGSGDRIKNAIKKHGRENFKKEVLFIFDNKEDMILKEKELVILDDMCYNIKLGGDGGWDYTNSLPSIREYNKRGYLKSIGSLSKEEVSLMRSKAKRAYDALNPGNFTGKKHRECTKILIGLKNNQKKEKNSQFGTIWVTDGINNKKIKKEENIPSGYRKGRVLRG